MGGSVKTSAAAFFWLFLGVGPGLSCENEPLATLMKTPPAGDNTSFDVSESGSTQGGVWEVYPSANSAVPLHVVRIDAGEMGYLRTQLTIASPGNYAVAKTDYTYSAPFDFPGSRVIREEKDIFVYCDGKLSLPEDVGGLEDYQANAKKVLATFDAPEIAKYVAGLTR